MTYYLRRLDIQSLLQKKSFFLFGPRSTGKTTLIRQQLPDATVYDLLDHDTATRLLRRPKVLEEEITPGSPSVIVIDEIQRLPGLLNEVHRLIEKHGQRFLLTGSSARKLKRGAANLLGGRAWETALFPLVWCEIDDFNLVRYLNYGGLPHVYLSTEPQEELHAYVNLYLREEVQAEALTRNIGNFVAFLDVMALSNGEEINYQSLSSDCGVSVSTLKNYIGILEDTLLGFSLEAFRETKKRKAISRAKHYFCDIGLVNTLCQHGDIRPKSPLFGKAFEHFVIQEVRANLSYSRSWVPMRYWRSTSLFEVDLILGNAWALEIKSTNMVMDKHLKGLRAFKEEGLVRYYGVVSLDPQPRMTHDGIHIFPWQVFLEKLWDGSLSD